jgi:3-phenylpropionate/cinnamic acid dioxygenase small subunit
MSHASELFFEVSQWLYSEAHLLDRGRYQDWLDLLAPEIRYLAPVRVTRMRSEGEGFQARTPHFEENLLTLQTRVKRLGSRYAWAEDPPSRTRHFVSNIMVEDGDDSIGVRSSLFLYRTRGDSPDCEQLSCEREDELIRQSDGKLKLAKRTILLDHSTLPVINMAILL